MCKMYIDIEQKSAPKPQHKVLISGFPEYKGLNVDQEILTLRLLIRTKFCLPSAGPTRSSLIWVQTLCLNAEISH